MRRSFPQTRVTRALGELLSLSALLLLGSSTLASAVRADAGRVAVLTLASDDVDERLIAQLSDAVRAAVRADGTFQLSEAKVSLDQLSMVQDCDASSDACLETIARGLSVDGLIYGSLASKGGRGANVEMHFFDAREKRSAGQADTIFATQAPPTAELEAKASTLVAKLLGTGAARSEPPLLAAPDAAAMSQTEQAPAARIENTDQPIDSEPLSSGMSGRKVVGYSLLGVSALSVGLTVLSFVQIDRAEGNEEFVAYAKAVGRMKPTVDDVCVEIDAGEKYGVSDQTFEGASSKCSVGSTYHLLQFVFIGAAVVSGGLSAYLLLGDDDAPGEHARAGRRSLAFQPLLTHKAQGFSARLRF